MADSESTIFNLDTDAGDDDDDNSYFDALDDFPFYDSLPNLEPPDDNTHNSSIESNISTTESSPLKGLRRRRSFSRQNKISIDAPDPTSPVSLNATPTTIHTASATSTSNIEIPRERKYRFSRHSKENGKSIEKSTLFRARLKEGVGHNPKSVVTTATDEKNENLSSLSRSFVTSANDQRVDDELNLGESQDGSFNIIFYLAGLVVKAIAFQVNLLVSFVSFPVWFLYSSYMFVTDPFHIVRRIKGYFLHKAFGILGEVRDRIMDFIWGFVKEHHSTWKLALRCCWGLLWAAYVCSMLCGLLVSAFIVGGILMKFCLEEPFQMEEHLNFDYSKDSPAAVVPIIYCPEISCGGDCSGMSEVENVGGARFVPPKHKLKATVSLTLPESMYNRNLGIFQVRVDFLSANGKALGSLRQPCMLQFKSQPIRLLLTLFKMAPLAAGYLSETQTLKIKFRGFTEKEMPTSCLRVTMEQRAEYRAGAGIPEIYEASLNLESELPLLKRIFWSWKTTIFVWTSMMIFAVELLFTLVCCKPVLVPKVRMRFGPSDNNARQNLRPAQM